jgi:hypothetical protein
MNKKTAFAKGAGPNHVLDEVVVDLQSAVVHELRQRFAVDSCGA